MSLFCVAIAMFPEQRSFCDPFAARVSWLSSRYFAHDFNLPEANQLTAETFLNDYYSQFHSPFYEQIQYLASRVTPSQTCSSNSDVSRTTLRHSWLSCMYFSLLNIINPVSYLFAYVCVVLLSYWPCISRSFRFIIVVADLFESLSSNYREMNCFEFASQLNPWSQSANELETLNLQLSRCVLQKCTGMNFCLRRVKQYCQ